ncbi:MAG: RidA family protein [Acidobacteria bacterium]|nr:RidA family protein [Acidobacteriota bacterium]MBS1864677.1 RidA family protein [Acidobacteriota bacterium]
MKSLATVLLLICASNATAQIKAVSPKNLPSSANNLNSPGILADGYLYISGQGPRRTDGTLPPDTPAQIRQALDNVKAVVEAAGLTLDHVVYLQVYLEDIRASGQVDKVFAEYFSNSSPARAILGVARVPEPPLEITAVAVQDLTGLKPVYVPGENFEKGYAPAVLTHDRLFVSAAQGKDPATGKIPDDPGAQVNFALDRLKSVVESAGLKLANMVFVNPYLTHEIPMHTMNVEYARRFEFGNTPGRATIQVSSLPGGVRIAYTGVAVRDLSRRHAIRPKNMPPSPTASPCVFAGDTLYCSAKSGFIPGPYDGVYAATTSSQTHQTMRNQLDNLEEAGMRFDQVVFTTVYLDDLSDAPQFERVYRKYFAAIPPARVNVQQIAPASDRKPNEDEQYPDLEQMSLIAVRTQPKQ